jgi:manganese transport protein
MMQDNNSTLKKCLNTLKYLGPGILVTVGFIDPGNWASNVAAGAGYGYTLLWMVTLSTLMLILLQHNAAHLGIKTGLCLSEAATKYLPAVLSRPLLFSGMLAAVATAFAEILGGAIAMNILFDLPVKIGAALTAIVAGFLLFKNTYRKMEKWIIGFVALIGLSFLVELFLVPVEWKKAAVGAISPAFPYGSMPIIMSVLGAVVMPHNLFLHSEIIQSRQFNLEGEAVITERMRGEIFDTFISMIIGWAINCAIIILAAATFFKTGTPVTDLKQAQEMLTPLAGKASALIFALALLFSGVSSSITAGMAAGSIFTGIFGRPYDVRDPYSVWGSVGTYLFALVVIFLVSDVFNAMVLSQMVLSIQLPLTIFLLIYITSSKRVMGTHANSRMEKFTLGVVAIVVVYLNIMLLLSYWK